MQEIVLFAVLGFGAGSLIAVNGLALVLFYQGSGTVNLATGAMAAFGGFVFYGLRNGYLFSPFPFGSPRFDVGGPLATLPALVIALDDPRVAENAPAGTVVGNLSGTDADLPEPSRRPPPARPRSPGPHRAMCVRCT